MSSKLPRALPRVTSMLCVLATVAAVAGCGEDAPPVSPSATLLTFRGELATYIADFDDGHSETLYGLVQADGTELRLHTGQAIRAQPGDALEVRGQLIGDDLHAESFEIIPARRDVAQLTTGQPLPPKRVAFVIIQNTATAPGLTNDAARQRVFQDDTAPDTSLNRYYQEISYGMQGITGDVIGPLNYTMTGCDTKNLSSTLRPMIPGTYDHYM